MFVEKNIIFGLAEEKKNPNFVFTEWKTRSEGIWLEKNIEKRSTCVRVCVCEAVNISFPASEHRNVTYDPYQMVDARKYPIQI